LLRLGPQSQQTNTNIWTNVSHCVLYTRIRFISSFDAVMYEEKLFVTTQNIIPKDKLIFLNFRFLWPCIVSKVWREKNLQDVTIRCLLLTSISTCVAHHYAHLQESKEPVTAFGVLFWWALWACEHCVLTCCKTAPHNRYQPHPAEPEQHTKRCFAGCEH
jgi:hypothetical protein